ncbi:MAG: DUF4405 domain-containing protein, partial [Bacteroidota bacterium]
MQRKAVSLFILFSFLILSVTGVFMYIQPFEKGVATLHSLAGFLFMVGVGLHLGNNIKAMVNYFRSKANLRINVSRTALGYVGVLSVISLMTLFGLPPFSNVYEWGRSLRGETDLYYKQIATNQQLNGHSLSVEVVQGNPTWVPTIAIWVEDQVGRHVQDLYVSQKLAKEKFINFNHKRRPEALPVWSHRRGVQAEDGLYVPDQANLVPDGMTGATPKSNFVLNSKLGTGLTDSVRVFLEVNQSFDWNEYYHEQAFPEDEVYSGPGKVGQPALVYATDLLALGDAGIHGMELLGRAHHSGQDGAIYEDLSTMTTAFSSGSTPRTVSASGRTPSGAPAGSGSG